MQTKLHVPLVLVFMFFLKIILTLDCYCSCLLLEWKKGSSGIVQLWAPQLTREKWHSSMSLFKCGLECDYWRLKHETNTHYKDNAFFLFLMLFSSLAQLLGQTREVAEISQQEMRSAHQHGLIQIIFRSAHAKWEPQKDKNLKHISDVFRLIYCAKCNPNWKTNCFLSRKNWDNCGFGWSCTNFNLLVSSNEDRNYNLCRFTHNQSLKQSTTSRYLRCSEMSNITKRKVKPTQYTTKFSIHIFMLLCQQNASFILDPSELAKSLTMCCWAPTFNYQQQWINSTQHRILFSHLHLCEGLVIVADVEQPESLGKHTTKRGKIT